MNLLIAHFSTRFPQALVAALVAALALQACKAEKPADEAAAEPGAPPQQAVADVNAERIINADSEPGNWLSHGRTYDEQRFSPLDQVNADNASRLGLAWYVDLDTHRGQEATPLVIDGVMYVSTAWSKVMALDAKTGETIWKYDPEVPGEVAVYLCCDVVNRGVAAWEGRIYVATLDGRLVALDAATGEEAWTVQTTDPDKPYTITAAPRIVKGKVIIGNAGAEYGVRGYVSAYDAFTGAMAWRFYTVPGNPADGFESPAMEMAAQTWNGEWWELGGGGTVWDSVAYDPDLDLLYVGVGNGSPWNQHIRSPGGGDNLFISSIVALDPDTGEYVWHFQTTPGDTWDFTATQHMILADLEIGGSVRKVIMQAPKNGFLFVLDRETGEFISAEPFVPTTWASGFDPETGRPNQNPDARFADGKPAFVSPGPGGAHNWQPMSFSPDTGLVYIPAQDASFPYFADANFVPMDKAFNVGVDFGAASMPPDAEVQQQILATVKGHLSAWDPVAQKEVWRVEHKGPWNGGVLTTAGNLVVQGLASGEFAVYRADNGEKLWSTDAQTGVIAAPMTYMVDGEQYLAIEVGWGGVYPLITGIIASKSGKQTNLSRVLVFKLDGGASLPPKPDPVERPLVRAEREISDEDVEQGKKLYHRFCVNCHGDTAVGGGVLPDLRRSPMVDTAVWDSVVAEGSLSHNGMVGFQSVLSAEEIERIESYVIFRARQTEESGHD